MTRHRRRRRATPTSSRWARRRSRRSAPRAIRPWARAARHNPAARPNPTTSRARRRTDHRPRAARLAGPRDGHGRPTTARCRRWHSSPTTDRGRADLRAGSFGNRLYTVPAEVAKVRQQTASVAMRFAMISPRRMAASAGRGRRHAGCGDRPGDIPPGGRLARRSGGPGHRFWLDREPVTNAQFLAFVRRTRSGARSRPAAFVEPGYLGHWASVDRGPPAPAPVAHVSWFAARAYCAARGGRLPREAEWELAAAADAHHRDATGDPRSGARARLVRAAGVPAVYRRSAARRMRGAYATFTGSSGNGSRTSPA